ncbi:MAG: ferritin-like domain-containing protein [Gallionella sp.]
MAARFWFAEPGVSKKAQGVQSLAQEWPSGDGVLDCFTRIDPTLAGRPQNPVLVSPLEVKRRSMNTPAGRAALIHALAHIEFTAINLALDAIWRFPGMPKAYYADWLKVAGEEALHFLLLERHLQLLGYSYGSFPAHNSLWEMAEKTQHDILARMAILPVTMEARGLDATPQVRAKLAQIGDFDAAAILDVILRDEIGHVAIGNIWYRYICQDRGLEPLETYTRLAVEYAAPVARGPYNIEARRAAGFTDAELAKLRQ